MNKERPTLFNGAMVRAILAGKKIQTRRAVKLPHSNPLGQWEASTSGGYGARDGKGNLVPEHVCIWHTRTGEAFSCPFGEPGDRLWVRETWGVGSRPDPWGGFDGIEYRADEGWLDDGDDLPCHKVATPDDVCLGDYRRGWKPSIHMPRWACRLVLEITAVRVEIVTLAENMRRNAFHNRYPPEVKELIHLKARITRRINKRTKEQQHEEQGQ